MPLRSPARIPPLKAPAPPRKPPSPPPCCSTSHTDRCRDRHPASPLGHPRTECAAPPAEPRPAAPTPVRRTAVSAAPTPRAESIRLPWKIPQPEALAEEYYDAAAAHPACPQASPV